MPARLTEAPGPKRVKSAVNRALVLRRESAAEVGSLNQGHRQPARCRVPRRRKPMDAPADDQQVEWRAR
jgi:hypothetical protein